MATETVWWHKWSDWSHLPLWLRSGEMSGLTTIYHFPSSGVAGIHT